MFKKNKIEEELTETKERIEKALSIAWGYAQINGSHHKMWTIDQMVRALCESEEEYIKWVEAYEVPYDDRRYEWNTGIEP